MELMKLFIWMLCCIPKIQAQNWSLACHVNGSTTPCSFMACVGDQVTFTLVAAAAQVVDGYVMWILPNGTCPNSNTPNKIVMETTPDTCRSKMGSCGPFNAVNIDPSSSVPCLKSNLSANYNFTNLLVQYGYSNLHFDVTVMGNVEILAKAETECHTPVQSISSSSLLHLSSSASAGTIGTSSDLNNATSYNPSGSIAMISPTLPPTNNPKHNISWWEYISWWKMILIILGIIAFIGIILFFIYWYCKKGRQDKRDVESCDHHDEHNGENNVCCRIIKYIQCCCKRAHKSEPISKSAAPQSNRNSLAKKIRNINELSGFKYKKKPILQIINTHWKELAPKLSIDPSDIREPAKSMCGRALISQWLKKAENPTWGELIKALKSTEPLKSVGQSMEKEILKKNQ